MSHKLPSSPSYPLFPMSEPHHFSDYGFDTQFDYFQVLEEARNHKREAAGAAASSSAGSIIDSLKFKLQKPVSASSDKSSFFSIDAGPQKTRSKKNKKRHRHWWNKAFFIFSCSSTKTRRFHHNHIFVDDDSENEEEERDVHHARARAFRASSVSGPVLYMAESGTGTPRRARSKPSSGPLGLGFVSPGRRIGGGSPYLSLRELNLEHQQHLYRMSVSSSPIYLAT